MVIVTGAVGSLLLSTVLPAQAGHVHVIQTAKSPSTGEPVDGGGSWIANKPSGYYIGRAMPGDLFDNEVTTPNNWHFGRAITAVNMCGWVMPGSLGTAEGDVPDSCSPATSEALSHRLTIGKDYNAGAHDAQDGTAADANTSCPLYYNYFHGTDFSSNGGHMANPAAGTTSATVRYRFTTRDDAAVVVRDPELGWGFLATGCVERPDQLFNDDD